MKLTMVVKTLTEVEVDCPEACPKCGFDFAGENIIVVSDADVTQSAGMHDGELVDFDNAAIDVGTTLVLLCPTKCGWELKPVAPAK